MEKTSESGSLRGLEGGDERLAAYIGEKLSQAYERASKHGIVIGRVSRYSEVATGALARVLFDVDPATYYTMPEDAYRIGSYIAIIDPKTGRAILARITRVMRRDQLASVGVEPPISGYDSNPDPYGLLTTTTFEAELIMEADPEREDEPVPAVTPVEPQSPVIDPRPELIGKLLDLPGDGVILGALATPAGLVKGGVIPVKLPYRSILQHILIIGTTGSGKTTLMKNMISSILSDPRGPLVRVVDMNQDFTQLPLPPPGDLVDDKVYSTVYRTVRNPRSVIDVVAVTRDVVRLCVESSNPSDLKDILLWMAREYYQDTYTPLTSTSPPRSWSVRFRENTHILESEVEWGRVTLIPYIISTLNTPTEKLAPLMPGMTTLAKELLRRVRERYKRLHGGYGPLQALHAGLLLYMEEGRGDGAVEESVVPDSIAPYIIATGPGGYEAAATLKVKGLGHSILDSVWEYYDLLKESRPHRGTVEALYRRVSALLDSDVVDVAVSWTDKRTVEIMPEPSWSTILEEAEAARSPIVLDLKWGAERGMTGQEGSRLVAYRMLERLIAWKHSEWARRRRTRSVAVFIDEAHQFFPQEGGGWEEAEASRQLASMISRIARLGRARGLGLIFSTHSPRDLHDIILQLTNTKILLRTEKQHAEKLDIPQEAKTIIPRLPDRAMYILSHVYREGYLIAVTSKPITAHFDVSTL